MGAERSDNRVDLIIVAVLWVALTGAGLWWATVTNLHPIGASSNAVISDEAFDLLLYLSMPVTTFVVVVLGYSVLRFRVSLDETEDAAPVRSNRLFIAMWVLITVGLSVYVIFNPGFTGLDALAADKNAEMTIEVTASQWRWDYRYVEENIEFLDADGLVLPVDTRILFKITSQDVIHSFWVPAFRVKKDAVPGLITEVYMTTTKLGDFAQDDGFRNQCAELCGTGHTRMRTTVTVLTRVDFIAWVDAQRNAEVSG
ncbi:MAG: cytochrome c oxidase subunit II [Actinomycetota bacterium]|nr:cytochrome c oxidase subunit II [Actinomycetota bacterium]